MIGYWEVGARALALKAVRGARGVARLLDHAALDQGSPQGRRGQARPAASAHVGTLVVTARVSGAKLVRRRRRASRQVPSPEAHPPGKRGRTSSSATAPERLENAPKDVKIEGGKPLELAMEPPVKLLPPPPPPPPPSAAQPEADAQGAGAAPAIGGVRARRGWGRGVRRRLRSSRSSRRPDWRSMADADVATHLSIDGFGCATHDAPALRVRHPGDEPGGRHGEPAPQRGRRAGGDRARARRRRRGSLFFMAPKQQPATRDNAAPKKAPSPACRVRRQTGGDGHPWARGAF